MRRTLFILSLAAFMVALLFTPALAAVNEIVWKKFFSDGTTDHVAVDRSGNIVIAGEMGGGGPFLRKLSGGGRILWTREFEEDRTDLRDMAVDADGYIYVVGATFRDVGQDYIERPFLRKYGPKGGHHWTRQFSEDSAALIRGVDIGRGGNIYVVGVARKALPNMPQASEFYDAFIRKYNSAGKIHWTRQFSLNDFKGATATFDVAVGPGGGVYVAGADLLASRPSSKLFLRKYSSRGGIYWTRRIGRRKPYTASDSRLAVDKSGEVTLVSNDLNTESREGFAVKYSHRGERLWTRLLDAYFSIDVTVDRDRNVYVVGRDDNNTAFNRKYSPGGAVRWTRHFANGSASGVAADSQNNVYVVGQPWGSGAVSVLAKFRR